MENEHNRKPGISRLSTFRVTKGAPDYIVMYYLINDLCSAIDSYAHGSILDIGCGNKPYKELLDKKTTYYVGCDVVQSSENLVDVICPADALEFPDNEFNTVLSTQVLEHVANHDGMVEEAYRILKPGGYAIFTVPFCWELHEEPYDFFRVSRYGLTYLFEKKGFEVVAIKSNGGKWAAIFQMFLNVLLSTRKYGTIRGKFIKWLFIRFKLIVLYNWFAIWLDKVYFDDVLTLNYIIIAKKS